MGEQTFLPGPNRAVAGLPVAGGPMAVGGARRVRRLSLGSHGSVALARRQRAGGDTRHLPDAPQTATSADGRAARNLRAATARSHRSSTTASMTIWPLPSSGTPNHDDCGHRYQTVRRSRKPVGDSIGMPWNGDMSRRSQSPVTWQSAAPISAASSSLSSSGSRHRSFAPAIGTHPETAASRGR